MHKVCSNLEGKFEIYPTLFSLTDSKIILALTGSRLARTKCCLLDTGSRYS